jgi:hypothetical protein
LRLEVEEKTKTKEKWGSQSSPFVGDSGEQSSPTSIGNGRPIDI